MAVIKFTKADVLRSQNLENEKWYSWQIVECKQQPTKDKTGINFLFNFRLIDTESDLDGKEIGETVNVSSNGRSWYSALLPIVAAVKGVPIDSLPKEDFEFDTDSITGSKIDGKHVLELYEGRMVGHVRNFVPYKTASNQIAF